MTTRVLVCDDEETAREELCEALRDAGYDTSSACDGGSALELALNQSFDVCISDIKMPGIDGIELLKKFGELSPETTVMMITAYGDMQTAIDALRYGATDYVLKPVLFEDILAKVERMVEYRRLMLEVRNMRRAIEHSDKNYSTGWKMVGDSPSMMELKKMITKVSKTRSNVLIYGESGCGKELVAKAIHENRDANRPFVPINCASIPETLLESELFGHVRGAFTGAIDNKEGLLKTAGQGTIFLDELGDMPMSIQAKLLRAIENREIQPVGSVRRIPIEGHIIAATNKSLPEQIENGLFREDLYYRLAVVDLKVPPLRERREDIPALVQFFIRKLNKDLGREVEGIERAALALLAGHNWRGNIRELENTIERAMIFCETPTLQVENLPEIVRKAAPVDPQADVQLAPATQRFERTHIHKIIDFCDGDKRAAANRLGVSLSSLYRKLNEV